MGQQEIYNFLKKEYKKGSKQWFSAKDLCKKTGRSIGAATVSIGKLRKNGFIAFKDHPTHKIGWVYRYR